MVPRGMKCFFFEDAMAAVLGSLADMVDGVLVALVQSYFPFHVVWELDLVC